MDLTKRIDMNPLLYGKISSITIDGKIHEIDRSDVKNIRVAAFLGRTAKWLEIRYIDNSKSLINMNKVSLITFAPDGKD
jgi:hypothetical protein